MEKEKRKINLELMWAHDLLKMGKDRCCAIKEMKCLDFKIVLGENWKQCIYTTSRSEIIKRL